MRYLLTRTLEYDVSKYKDQLQEFEVEYIEVIDYCEEKHTIAILTLKDLDDLDKFSSVFEKIVIENIRWEIDFIDYEPDEDITKIIDIYDGYRE